MQLRTYQKRAVGEVMDYLKSGTSTVLVAPTGAGKTVIGAAVAENFKRVMVIAHRREILQQARETFGWHVHVRSVQGFSSDRAAGDFRPKKLDLLIIDEAHRSTADTYKRIINQYPDAARLGLTATPLRTDGRGLSDSFSALVECLSVRELIEAGHLTPYRALEAPDEALKELAWMHRLSGDYQINELSALMSRPRLVGDVVREYVKHGTGRTAVAFAVTVEHSEKLAEAFEAAGVRAAHMDGHASDTTRRRTLALLESGKLDVLCNVNLFTEGWDCPSVSCVIMARPTASLTLYLQSVGRGMRPSEGKQDLLILDHAGNMQRHGYPDVERDWSLEGPREKAEREARERERARLSSLGLDSVEAELLERARIIDVSYSSSETIRLLGVKPKTLSLFLRSRGVRPLYGYKGPSVRYARCDVDQLIQNAAQSYSKSQVRALMGKFATTTVLAALPRHGRAAATRYESVAVHALLAKYENSYSASECENLLGISKAAASTWLRKFGICKTVGNGNTSRYPKVEIERLAAHTSEFIASSYSSAECSAALGLSLPGVRRLLETRGVSPLDCSRVSITSSSHRYLKSEVDNLVAERLAQR